MDSPKIGRRVLRAGMRGYQDISDSVASKVHCAVIASAGRRCAVSRRVAIRNPEKVSFGDGVVVKSGVILNGRSTAAKGGISFGTQTYVREYSYLDCYGGFIRTEEYVAIGQFCVFDGEGGLEIGKYSMIGSHVYVIGSNHKFDSLDLPYKLQGNTAYGINIGSNVWIGGGSIILDGVTIGDNAVVCAGSIVTKSIAANTIHSDAAPRELTLKLGRELSSWSDVLASRTEG